MNNRRTECGTTRGSRVLELERACFASVERGRVQGNGNQRMETFMPGIESEYRPRKSGPAPRLGILPMLVPTPLRHFCPSSQPVINQRWVNPARSLFPSRQDRIASHPRKFGLAPRLFPPRLSKLNGLIMINFPTGLPIRREICPLSVAA